LLVKRSLANFAAANLDHLVCVVKRKLKKIQYRPHPCWRATWPRPD
jgi:hypothetical protein